MKQKAPGGQGMFWRLTAASLTRGRNRVWATLLAVVIGTAVLAALVNVYLDMTVKLSRELRAYGANLAVAPAEGSGPLRLAALDRVLAAWPGAELVGAAPYLFGVAGIRKEKAVLAGQLDTVVVGSRFADLKRVNPYWSLEGDWPAAGAKKALVGVEIAEDLRVRAGDVLLIGPEGRQQRLTVAAVLRSGGPEDGQVLLDLDLAGALLGRPGEVDGMRLSVVGQGDALEARAKELMAAVPGAVVRPMGRIARAEEVVLARIRLLILLVGMVMLLATLLCLITTMVSNMAERRLEMGLKKALGAPARRIGREFVIEAALMGLGGGLLGLPVGYALAQVIGRVVFAAPISFRWLVLPLALGVAAGLAALAAWIPVRQVADLQPASVLRGD